MRMIEPGRTNVVPLTMLLLCIGLFLSRTAAIFYGAFFQPALDNMISWNQPKPLDKSRRDLLSTPTLYFFCDTSDQVNQIWTQILDNMLFHNQEIATLIKEKMIPVKVVLHGENSDALSKSLKDSLHVTSCPAICLALPNGKLVNSASWQSDRMFVAFLKDGLKRKSYTAALEAMRNNDWVGACRAYEIVQRESKDDIRFDLYDKVYWSIALRHIKDETKARAVLEDALKRTRKSFKLDKKDNWPEPCVDYLLGNLSYDELMKAAAANKKKSNYHDETVHYICGVKYLLDGNDKLARKELRMVAENQGARYLYAAKFARAELRALGEKFPERDDDDDDLSI
jgi:hypothetical protein